MSLRGQNRPNLHMPQTGHDEAVAPPSFVFTSFPGRTGPKNVADTRIHGTTKKQVRQQLEDIERPALMPLPRNRFANFHEAKRAVSRDGHLEVNNAFYSGPAEYIGRSVWVRRDTRLVRVFNDQWRQSRCTARSRLAGFARTPLIFLPKKCRPSNAEPMRFCGTFRRSGLRQRPGASW